MFRSRSYPIMTLRKLPLDIQSMFSASAQIRTYKTAVEELVFNALDANSSSIAIRLNIQENYVQVVDNGHGVASEDFKILGQRYTTSKYEEPTTSKSNLKYGCCGQSLANLIEVSQSVKITSRCIHNVETWTKSFCNGKEDACTVTASRPSVGTTIEIKGFLYNLCIQKKAMKPLQEIHSIKTFLEHMSLVHCNTSISLRDNFENEVIFKAHKNRDIIQTLASVLSIETCNIKEFQVEKNQYKVIGLIQNNSEESKGYHWIYVNERFTENSNLHKIVNENLAKGLVPVNNNKIKGYKNEEEKVKLNNKIPDYFIFIKCPPNDYDVISNTKRSIMEFKNLVPIDKLLEKLVRFYMGDIHLIRTTTEKEPIIAPETIKAHETDTRNKVKQIIQNILGTQRRKISGSALHNGVKGKMIRRKSKKKLVFSPNPKLKLKHENGQFKEVQLCELEDATKVQNQSPSNNNINNCVNETSFQAPTNKQETRKRLRIPNQQQKQLNKEKQRHGTQTIPNKKNANFNKDPVLSKFEKETDEVQKRCNILAKKVDHLLGIKKKRKCKVFTNETVHYGNIVKDNKSISIRKKINEIIIHEYLPVREKNKTVNDNTDILNNIKKSNDLIHPVTNIVEQNNFSTIVMPPKIVPPQSNPYTLDVKESFDSKIPEPTYESHRYLKRTQVDPPKDDTIEKRKRNQFISKISGDNFASIKTKRNGISKRNAIKKRELINKRHNNNNIHNRLSRNVVKSSYMIHVTETGSSLTNETRKKALKASDVISLGQRRAPNYKNYLASLSDKRNIGNTYTVADSDKPITLSSSNSKNTCILDTTGNYNHEANCNATSNVNINSEQSLYTQKTQSEAAVDAHKGLDNNVIFISNTQNPDIGTNDIEPLTVCEAVIGCHNDRDREEYTFIFDSINNVIERNISSDMQSRQNFEKVTNHNFRINEEDSFLNINLQKVMDDCIHMDYFESNNFSVKNRRRYIPKGMSPIFEHCNLKTNCNYKFDEDYFKETVYDKFEQNVRIHSAIFEPKIQNVTETATRHIQRLDTKRNQNNASLIFNGESLKQTTVLGQVDSKFIATIMKGKSNGVDNDCLVLFDQHAVHERIRLEQNMSEYITNGQWKSVSLDDVSLTLTRDEMLYLHNYRDKFQKLGAQWTVASDTQILINAIPQAILGKHSRQVDVVLNAVKNLIKEEIRIIKEQGGCASLYPKSIMDLVFSEACRYAVMFGDALSACECVALLEALSRCGTPFRCAHGRPAMAVLVEVVRETRPYTVNFTKVEQFRRKQFKVNK